MIFLKSKQQNKEELQIFSSLHWEKEKIKQKVKLHNKSKMVIMIQNQIHLCQDYSENLILAKVQLLLIN
jgi:hypothetical protein